MQTLALNPTSISSPTLQGRPGDFPEGADDRPFSASRSHRSNPNFSRLPPLITSPTARAPPTPRPLSQASQSDKFFSARTHPSGPRTLSRPQSTVFPAFHSSLSYTHVRDFAWPADHPLHYGASSDAPPPNSADRNEERESEQESDDAEGPWYGARKRSRPPRRQSGPRLPATSFNDGPPWSEDEDLLSPIVTTSKHKRGKSSYSDFERASGQSRTEGAPDASPELPQQRRHSADDVSGDRSWQGEYRSWPGESHGQSDPSYFALDRGPPYADDSAQFASEDEPTPLSEDEDETSRYSRDYQFTIASPDEEMHGKAVALFDFTRENENELPLLEGQVLWVSYRHGQGWLVAQDPKSGESGLVPEEYVRLLRDIEGGLNRLQGIEGPEWESSPTFNLSSGDSPMSAFHERTGSGTSGNAGSWSASADGGGSAQHYTPVQSHFSTSSKDLEPYPQHHLLVASQSHAHGNALKGATSPTSDITSPASGGVSFLPPIIQIHPSRSLERLDDTLHQTVPQTSEGMKSADEPFHKEPEAALQLQATSRQVSDDSADQTTPTSQHGLDTPDQTTPIAQQQRETPHSDSISQQPPDSSHNHRVPHASAPAIIASLSSTNREAESQRSLMS